MKNKQLIVLAGGFGTRLQLILNGKPKPLADINGVPFLQLLFVNWIEQGFSNFILSLHYEAEQIISLVEELKKTILRNCEVQYVIEFTPLGTGGAISHVVNELNLINDVFIANADTWVDSGFKSLIGSKNNVIGIVRMENTSRYGKVLLNNDNNVVKFEEKENKDSPGFINAGIYKLSSSLFTAWNGKAYSLERELFPILIQKQKLCAVEIISNFIDIGVPEDYYKFCRIIKLNL
jgi:D-glycero-alpha-D-manno-heptose 1-phosphate guanylyltransferase